MAEEVPLQLSLRLDGVLVEAHRLPLSELGRLTRQLRLALRDVAIVLSDSGPSGRSGRVQKFIEEATDLRVVAAPRAGSFCLDLEAPPDTPRGQEGLPVDLGPALGERAVQAFVDGLHVLSEETEELPPGFDRGVLQAILPFRTTLKRGVSDITLTIGRNGVAGASTRIDSTKIEVARQLISKPIRGHALVEGVLQMVDFSSLECRVDRPPLPSVTCYFDEGARDAVHEAVRKFVRVIGEGEFPPEQREPTKIWAESIRVLYEALPFDPELFWREHDLRELAEEQRVPVYKLPPGVDADPWRDDDEAAQLVAALANED